MVNAIICCAKEARALVVKGLSEFGVPAVDHKIACDWERVGIKVASICSS